MCVCVSQELVYACVVEYRVQRIIYCVWISMTARIDESCTPCSMPHMYDIICMISYRVARVDVCA